MPKYILNLINLKSLILNNSVINENIVYFFAHIFSMTINDIYLLNFDSLNNKLT